MVINNEKYTYIYMGIGNGLSIDNNIYDNQYVIFYVLVNEFVCSGKLQLKQRIINKLD